ncbi:carbon storage regulator CsrA [Nocardioides sp. LMS-CY]|uniref:Translational regulator CsrA n=1 Tax=Nocardioides soli TaxID=1036020 RepID=A0A7W4VWE3_9ACTN|nr:MULTISPECIES: carbon storage regulator CsrA [Nocardioides]MBB3043026.1 carbon storage regulator [Nocardioides soli]QWF23118.1 carbon storage regulator CsrA [Nocardioides sp. LMS-CY]
MLVLSRRAGESVVLGEDITVTVLEVRGDVVRIGIDAPRSLRVHRAELLAQLEESNRQAASPSADLVAQLSKALGRDRDTDSD